MSSASSYLLGIPSLTLCIIGLLLSQESQLTQDLSQVSLTIGARGHAVLSPTLLSLSYLLPPCLIMHVQSPIITLFCHAPATFEDEMLALSQAKAMDTTITNDGRVSTALSRSLGQVLAARSPLGWSTGTGKPAGFAAWVPRVWVRCRICRPAPTPYPSQVTCGFQPPVPMLAHVGGCICLHHLSHLQQ